MTYLIVPSEPADQQSHVTMSCNLDLLSGQRRGETQERRPPDSGIIRSLTRQVVRYILSRTAITPLLAGDLSSWVHCSKNLTWVLLQIEDLWVQPEDAVSWWERRNREAPLYPPPASSGRETRRWQESGWMTSCCPTARKFL